MTSLRYTPRLPTDDEKEQLQREVERLRDALAQKEAQLDRIHRSLGWRLLQRYGRFKHGVLIPLLGQPLLYRYGRFKHKTLLPAIARVSGKPVAPSARLARGKITYAEWAAECERLRDEPARESPASGRDIPPPTASNSACR